MKLRIISENDFNGIHDLVYQVHELHVNNRSDVYNAVDPFDKEYFQFLLKDEDTIALVSEIEQQIVGFCVVTLKQPSKNPIMKTRQVAFMECLCVDKQHRKCGIGRALFNKATTLSKQKGADVMELMVWSFNNTAIKFYENMGMSPRSIIMEKTL